MHTSDGTEKYFPRLQEFKNTSWLTSSRCSDPGGHGIACFPDSSLGRSASRFLVQVMCVAGLPRAAPRTRSSSFVFGASAKGTGTATEAEEAKLVTSHEDGITFNLSALVKAPAKLLHCSVGSTPGPHRSQAADSAVTEAEQCRTM